MESRNLEPRRFWAKRPRNSERLYRYELICSSCGELRRDGEWRGRWFCHDCIQWTRGELLDPDYDDLGLAG